MIRQFSSLGVQDERPLRRNLGTVGQPVTLRSNFFAVRLPKNMVLYEYRIEFSPNAKKDERLRLFELLEARPAIQAHLDHIAHDKSGRLISAKELPPEALSHTIMYYTDADTAARQGAKTFRILIEFVTTLDTNKIHE